MLEMQLGLTGESQSSMEMVFILTNLYGGSLDNP